MMNLIYKKSLRLSNSSRKESTVGQMVCNIKLIDKNYIKIISQLFTIRYKVNIIAVNAQSFVEMPHHLNMAWSCFFSITIAIVLLWIQLGLASIAGVLVMFILIPLNSFVTNQSKKLQIKKLKHQDSRVKIINELLNGIKVSLIKNLFKSQENI